MKGYSNVVLIAAMILAPSYAFAQDESGGTGLAGGCGNLNNFCSGGEGTHNTSLGPVGSVFNPHSSCMICSTGVLADCHPSCQVSAIPSKQDAYKAILVAAGNHDVLGILRLAGNVEGYVTYNAERKSIQVTSCDKHTVIASIVVPDPLVRSTVASLPTALRPIPRFLVLASR